MPPPGRKEEATESTRMSINWEDLYWAIHKAFENLDFKSMNAEEFDGTMIELEELGFSKDAEHLTEKYERFCRKVERLWGQENEAYDINVSYYEPDHIIQIAVKLNKPEPNLWIHYNDLEWDEE